MRTVTCRYLRRNGEQCTAPALDPDGDVLICAKHLSRALPALDAVRHVAFGPEAKVQIERDAAVRRELKERQRHAGLVYYAEAWGHIKIGTTVDIENRMKELKATRVLATEPGSHQLEAQRHRQFATARVLGEYFRPTPGLLAHVEALCVQHGPPITTTAEQLSRAPVRRSSSRREARDPARLGAERLAAALRPR